MSQRIPEVWKQSVITILAKGHSKHIRVTTRAVLDFQSLFPGAFTYEIYKPFIRFLSEPDAEGRRVYGMKPEGETYEFIFKHQQRDLYGKVCLTTDGRIVVIFSAHRPLKGDTV